MLRNRHVAVWISAIVFFLLGAIWYTALQAPWLAGGILGSHLRRTN